MTQLHPSTEASVIALNCLAMAIINTHPDKKELLRQYDVIVSTVQAASIGSGSGVTPEILRHHLDTVRHQIAGQV